MVTGLSSWTILRFGGRWVRGGRWLDATGDDSVRGRGRGRERWALVRGGGRVIVADPPCSYDSIIFRTFITWKRYYKGRKMMGLE